MATSTESLRRLQGYLNLLHEGEPTPVFEHEGQTYMRCRMVLDLPKRELRFTDENGEVVYTADLPHFTTDNVLTFEEIVFAITINVGSGFSGDPNDDCPF